MLIQEMTNSECLGILTRMRLGRLACAHDNQPYIVPIYFVYQEPFLYSFTTPGQKVDWMRTNPLVCVELDEVEADDKWMSILIFGRYEELQGPSGNVDWDQEQRRTHAPGQPPTGLTWENFQDRDRLEALELLQRHAGWWEVGIASASHRSPEQVVMPVFYRIVIDRVTGRRARPGAPVAPSPSVPGKAPRTDNVS